MLTENLVASIEEVKVVRLLQRRKGGKTLEPPEHIRHR
jgi:hypothetical protein